MRVDPLAAERTGAVLLADAADEEPLGDGDEHEDAERDQEQLSPVEVEAAHAPYPPDRLRRRATMRTRSGAVRRRPTMRSSSRRCSLGMTRASASLLR